MIVDAVILAGGRSRRLGGVPKSSLLIHGRTLLELTVAAVTSRARSWWSPTLSAIECRAFGP